MVDLIDFHIEREGHVMADHLKAGIVEEMANVLFGRGVIVIDAQNVIAIIEQPFTQV
jgi:hypothetical protein